MPKPPEKKPRMGYRPWLIGAGCLLLFGSTAWGARTVHQFLISDPRFALRPAAYGSKTGSVLLLGAAYTSAGSVQQVFSPDYGRSIFDINIAERRRRLLAIPWIQEASVARVWPNRIYVRVRERKPVLFVNLPQKSFALIDAEGVLLPMPPRAQFEFPILSGIRGEDPEAERKTRVEAALRLLEDLGPAAKDVSEVNAASVEDMRITADVQGKVAELWLGDGNFAERYRNFTDHLADIRAGSPRASVFDLRIDDRITAK